ncbi:hypothetical protein BU23DRAFT_568096 [Bimuria novae-zelandiae CBS 107.79]|uniref:Ig-like domain-containing protein n=1 Tax=Bimuria novae-zelandiae CBS 107.79 TaxID=1447943 RepID=A0A6A5VCI5_9PLEO|nr:hypothetical protein BU23DRAFT_568096 [Bimuria novae-zelandiae CBS 107.79]
MSSAGARRFVLSIYLQSGTRHTRCLSATAAVNVLCATGGVSWGSRRRSPCDEARVAQGAFDCPVAPPSRLPLTVIGPGPQPALAPSPTIRCGPDRDPGARIRGLMD